MKERGEESLVTALAVDAIFFEGLAPFWSESGVLCCVVLLFGERMRCLVDAEMVERGDPAEPTETRGTNLTYIVNHDLLL